MKKKLALLLCVLMLAGSLLACGTGGAGAPSAAMDALSYENAAAEEAGVTTAFTAAGTRNDAYSYKDAPSASVAGGAEKAAPAADAKLIYTASLTMETTDFDAAASALDALAKDCGGYFESSSVSNYGDGYRSADYTVRVPAERFDAFLSRAGELCHVLQRSTNAEDVSEYYYDTAGRLKTQQTKLERLQTLLARAEKMEDILTVESAISETEAQIESLSGELGHYDALVDYATVCLSLSEVYRLSGTEEPAQGFSARFLSALSSGWRGFADGFLALLVALAYGWVWVALLAVAAAVVLRLRARRRAKRARADGKAAPDGESPGGGSAQNRE